MLLLEFPGWPVRKDGWILVLLHMAFLYGIMRGFFSAQNSKLDLE